MADSDIRLCVLAFCGDAGQEIGVALQPSRQRGKQRQLCAFPEYVCECVCMYRHVRMCEIIIQ